MTEVRERELPVKRISIPQMYTWPAAPKRPPVDGWPAPPELDYSLYRIESKHWSGTIKVRKILLDEFTPERAVPFTVWGYILKEHGDEWKPLFEKYGRHEIRKQFIESIRFEAVEGVD